MPIVHGLRAQRVIRGPRRQTSSLHGCLIYAHQNTLRITREYAPTQGSADQTLWDGVGRASICQRSTTSKHWGTWGRQLESELRKNVPFVRYMQPAVFLDDQLIYAPTLTQRSVNLFKICE